MAGEKHLLLSIIGDYTDAANVTESWVNTLRLALVFGAVDPVGTLPSDWNPVAQTINRTETFWTITSNWKITKAGASFQPDDYLNNQVAPAVSTWMGAFARSSRVRVRELKLSPIGAPTGRVVPAAPYTSGTPCLLTYTSAYPAGGNSGELLPLQNAAVASHRTAQVGRHGRGRMYVNGLVVGDVQADGRFAPGQKVGALSGQVALLQGLSYTGAGLGAPQVRPIVTGKPWVNYGIIEQVRVGDVIDTQRRRRRNLVESISSAPVSY